MGPVKGGGQIWEGPEASGSGKAGSYKGLDFVVDVVGITGPAQPLERDKEKKQRIRDRQTDKDRGTERKAIKGGA